MMKRNLTVAVAAFLLCALAARAQNVTERLHVDATDAPRNILHATLTVPVAAGAIPKFSNIFFRSRFSD